MYRLYPTLDDFEALIRILTPEEGGRSNAPFNGIRWDFCYEGDRPEDSLYMIWPDFIDPLEDSLPTNKPLPVGVELPARMTVLVDEMRSKVHRTRIQVGTKFYCQEGPKRVAIGQVTKVTGLFNARPNA